MGEEFAVPGEPLSDNIVIGMPYLAEVAEAFAKRHGLTLSAELEELLDELFGLSCRDQGEEAFDPQRMGERRRKGYSLAKTMQNEAAAMLASLERLHRDWQSFDEHVQSKPALLEAIFDLDTGGPSNLCLPRGINILQTLFRTDDDDGEDELRDEPSGPLSLDELQVETSCPAGFWEAVDRRLQAVANLPVRTQLPRGPVPNMVVRDALLECRQYWIATEQRWSMGGLKVAAVRQENVVANLTGSCEKFVADALNTTGVKFNLHELHSAWETIDAAQRNGKAAGASPK